MPSIVATSSMFSTMPSLKPYSSANEVTSATKPLVIRRFGSVNRVRKMFGAVPLTAIGIKVSDEYEYASG